MISQNHRQHINHNSNNQNTKNSELLTFCERNPLVTDGLKNRKCGKRFYVMAWLRVFMSRGPTLHAFFIWALLAASKFTFCQVAIPHEGQDWMKSQVMVPEVLCSFHPLRPSDATCRHWSRSTLAQIMTCCLTAPIHYLNQCWLIISEVQWQSPEGNFPRDTSATNH